jgi:hypothetical protein
MKLGIMQPYFLPYLGYFALIKHTDYWIVFDIVQFIRQGWIGRNRILKPGGGWQYIMVPLEKSSTSTPIKDKKIRTNESWQKKILLQLMHYKKKAPYYIKVIELLETGFEFNDTGITKLNVRLIKIICDYLCVPFNYGIFSEMDIPIGAVNEPDEWALEISKALKADTYLNPPGGMEFFNREKFEKAGINLKFLKVNLQPYNQLCEPFEPGLSIIDVMMFNSPEEISIMLDQYELI